LCPFAAKERKCDEKKMLSHLVLVVALSAL